jgi:hypothetical protein
MLLSHPGRYRTAGCGAVSPAGPTPNSFSQRPLIVRVLIAVGWAKPTSRANARLGGVPTNFGDAANMVGTARDAPLPTLRLTSAFSRPGAKLQEITAKISPRRPGLEPGPIKPQAFFANEPVCHRSKLRDGSRRSPGRRDIINATSPSPADTAPPDAVPPALHVRARTAFRAAFRYRRCPCSGRGG